MLRTLSLRDFVIVDQNHIEFDDGFTVFSGETGAGKSILIDALSLVLGGRGDAGVVRQQAERADITAHFNTPAVMNKWLQAHDIEADNELILRRVIDKQGRSRAYINGVAATVSQLREVGQWLVDIHGQHAHQSLLNPHSHGELLDAQGQHWELRTTTQHAWQQLQQAQHVYQQALELSQSHAQELELLDWQIQQLTDLDLQAGDWEQLTQEHQRLAHAQSLLDSAGRSLHLLDADEKGALALIHNALQQLQTVVAHDDRLNPIYQLIESAHIACAEGISDLNSYLSAVELDPERLAHIDQHMASAFNLARKHKCEPEELPQLLMQLQQRQHELQQAIDVDALKHSLAQAEKHYQHYADQLSAARTRSSQQLSQQVSQAMQQLSMEGGRFIVQLQPTAPSATGNEKVEFLVAGHAGVEPAPLGKVASGGELARISLALSVIASQAKHVPTLIFDEVDSGIGGAVAEVVGGLMHQLGLRNQVLCVTHLPQVAAYADHHHLVSKAYDGAHTVSRIEHLNTEQRLEEIARMLGGIEITAATREHAKEMLQLKNAS